MAKEVESEDCNSDTLTGQVRGVVIGSVLRTGGSWGRFMVSLGHNLLPSNFGI